MYIVLDGNPGNGNKAKTGQSQKTALKVENENQNWMIIDYTDREIVDGILGNNQAIIHYFFYTRCHSLLNYIIKSMFDDVADRDELVNELYIYLQANDWHKVRQFDFRSKLTTWTSVVAIRFFQKKRLELIDSSHDNTLCSKKAHSTECTSTLSVELKMDIKRAIRRIKNSRYQDVILALDINDIEPEVYAKQNHITVDNVYNLRRRAHLQLSLIMNKKEDYYE